MCRGNTFKRKFPLMIMVEDGPALSLGLTCKYCARCEFIIAHSHELEAELCTAFEKIAPAKIGNDYHVVGVMDKKVWKKGLKAGSPSGNAMDAVIFFKQYLTLEYSPGGWFYEGDQ